MFKINVNKDIASFWEEGLPGFLREIDEGILRGWREAGYRTDGGTLKLETETADRAYYFDVRQRGVFFRLVIGVKKSGNGVIVICNAVYYPRDDKYILIGAIFAGLVVGTFFYYLAVEPYVYSTLEKAAAWFLSVICAVLANFFSIRYFYSIAKKRIRPGGRGRSATLALEREARELARLTLLRYGDFVLE